jgi:hypothetical protein
MSHRWSPLGRRGACLVLGVMGATALAPLAAQADPASDGIPPYAAAAGADGVRLSVRIPGAPLSADVINGGGPSAAVALSSVGVRRGFGALPDPGDGAMAGPGTAAGALGTYGAVLPAAVPAYPFAAVADPGTPEQTIGGGPFYAKATSAERKVTGEAQGGFLQQGTSVLAGRSEASAEESEAGVVAHSSSLFKGLVVGPLTLGDVMSAAEVSLAPGGTVQRKSSLEVVGGRAGDTVFTITGKGIVLGSQTVPVPIADGVASLNQQLAASKVTIGFTTEHETANGVVAPVLEVTSPVRSLSPGLPEGTMVLRIGGSAASIDTEASQAEAILPAQPASTQSDTSSAPEIASATGAPAAGTGGVAAAEGPLFGAEPGIVVGRSGVQLSSDMAGVDFAAPSSSTPESGSTEVAFAATPSPSPMQAAPASRSVDEEFGAKNIYLVIAVAALVGIVAGRFLRVGGQWNS